MNPKNIVILDITAAITISTVAAEVTFITMEPPTGVLVQNLKIGDGASPTASNVVKVRYKGTLSNGIEFDNSYSGGEAVEFPLFRVIPCWTQGIQTMRVGGKAKLTCQANTAYSERSVDSIPANSALYLKLISSAYPSNA